MVIPDSDENHQWMLKLVNESLRSYRIIISTPKKIIADESKNLPDNAVMNANNLNISCSLMCHMGIQHHSIFPPVTTINHEKYAKSNWAAHSSKNVSDMRHNERLSIQIKID